MIHKTCTQKDRKTKNWQWTTVERIFLLYVWAYRIYIYIYISAIFLVSLKEYIYKINKCIEWCLNEFGIFIRVQTFFLFPLILFLLRSPIWQLWYTYRKHMKHLEQTYQRFPMYHDTEEADIMGWGGREGKDVSCGESRWITPNSHSTIVANGKISPFMV